jgi:hypothetical protein
VTAAAAGTPVSAPQTPLASHLHQIPTFMRNKAFSDDSQSNSRISTSHVQTTIKTISSMSFYKSQPKRQHKKMSISREQIQNLISNATL